VIDHFGALDVLVNCAGINHRVPVAELAKADYDRILTVNLRAPFLLSQQASRGMAERGGGRIVNVGSTAGQIAFSGISAYGMSKAGLAQMTRQMALEWAPLNIQVNCVMPGFIRTNLTNAIWEDPRRSRWMLEHIPMRRGGSTAEVASAVLFLACPASSYITGICLAVDGGVLAGMPGYGESDR